MTPAKKLYTLTEVSGKTGISMPTLQRYKKSYQSRIPSVGEGRKQRYPKEAFKVLEEIKKENLKKRGRPPKKKSAAAASKAAPKAAAKASESGEGLLTLLEIGRRTGISYPTLLRYVKLHGRKIPSVGSGRKRRYPADAVAVFQEIRGSSKRGPKSRKPAVTTTAGRAGTVADPALAKRISELEKAQREVSKQLDSIVKLLKKPIQITLRSG